MMNGVEKLCTLLKLSWSVLFDDDWLLVTYVYIGMVSRRLLQNYKATLRAHADQGSSINTQ